MGYYSDVVVVMSKEQWVRETLIGRMPIGILNEFDSHTSTDSKVIWQTTGVKWNNAFPDVSTVYEWLSAMEQDPDADSQFGFMRLGEEMGDVETVGWPYEFDVYPVQYIQID